MTINHYANSASVWWDDGEPDMNRKLVRNTHYKDWFEALEERGQSPGWTG